jgi:hypothetical protein
MTMAPGLVMKGIDEGLCGVKEARTQQQFAQLQLWEEGFKTGIWGAN